MVSPKERVAFRAHWGATRREATIVREVGHIKVVTSKLHWTPAGRNLIDGNIPEMLSEERSREDIHRADTLGLMGR